MIYVFGSILCGAYLILFFKVIERLGIPNLQAIIVNYMACVACGLLFNKASMPMSGLVNMDWFYWALVLGLCFIVGFNLIGYTVQKAGVTPASVASKLSMIVSVPITIWLFNDSITAYKIVGLLFAVMAVVFSSIKEGDSWEQATKHLVLPGIVLAISGIIEIIISYNQKNGLAPEYFAQFLTISFGFAAMLGWIYFIYIKLRTKVTFHPKAWLTGVLLGVPNYFSLYFFLEAFNTSGWPASVLLPVCNIGVLLTSTILGWVLFKDKLSTINIVGLGLSLVAIYLLAFSL